MATRALITIHEPAADGIGDGTFLTIGVHWDGGPRWAGQTLLKHYTTPAQHRALLALGDLSVLAATPAECVAYHRNLHESWLNTAPTANTSYAELIEEVRGGDWEYHYLWIDGQWHARSKRPYMDLLGDLKNFGGDLWAVLAPPNWTAA